MTEAQKSIYLIVCSDDRAGELAKVLSAEAIVYRSRSRDETTWQYSKWEGTRWSSANKEELGTNMSVLFFHIGRNDPTGIPKDLHFKKEFAFSTGGVGVDRCFVGHERAIAIQRPFATGACPVRPEHLPQLKAFVEGSRREPPDFCKTETAHEILPALAILCQGYLAVCAQYKEQKSWRDEDIAPALKEMGWLEFMAAEAQKSLGKRILRTDFASRKELETVQAPEWWWRIFSEDTKEAALDVVTKGIEQEWKEARPKEVDNLLGMIRGNCKTGPMIVAKAYCAIAEKLSGKR